MASGVTHVHWNYNIHRINSAHMRREVAKLKLDVMVYGEVGMDAMSYFLAFSRFARRSILFWGHAVTSGIVDDVMMTTPQSGVNVSRVQNLRAGGPDYFVSSILFEDTQKGGRQCAQLRYSERLVLMEVWYIYLYNPTVNNLWRNFLGVDNLFSATDAAFVGLQPPP